MNPINLTTSLSSLILEKINKILPASVAINIGTEIIEEILNLEEEALRELLKLLGIGNNVDTVA